MKSTQTNHNKVDNFLHYDSSLFDVDDDEKLMSVIVPQDGIYYFTAHNVALQFPDDYTVDEFTGYLCVCEFDESQSGIVKVSGNESRRGKGLLFPLQKPSDPHPKCKIWQKVSLRASDHFSVKYVDKDLKMINMKRIVVTFHCVDERDDIYIA